MRVLILALVVLGTAWLHASPASASPASDFAAAREAFQHGDYRGAIPLLKDLLYPTARLSSRAQLAEAHLLLGVAHFETDNAKDAAAEFGEALRYDEELTLDPLLFTEAAIKFFEEEKHGYQKRAAEEAEKRKLAEERDAYRRALANLVVVEKHPYYINFIPFGAGQFQNGQSSKALFFSIAEATTGGTSMAIFGYLWIKYGYRGKVAPEDASSVRRLQQIQITTGGMCLGLMIWGIVDSLRNYRPQIQRKADESLLPQDFLRKPGEPPAPTAPTPKPSSSLQLLPTIVPSGVGVALTVEF